LKILDLSLQKFWNCCFVAQ